jgi:hypothetical protein
MLVKLCTFLAHFLYDQDALLQGMAEFIMQGKHYAATQGRGHFADDEVLDLPGMYAATHKPQRIEDLVNKVRNFINA